MTSRKLVALSLLVTALSAPIAIADTPSADYIFPAGGQRGTVVPVRVGANYLHGEAEFELRGEGLHGERRVVETETRFFEGPMIYKPASQRAENYPRDHAGRITIDPDAPLGAGYWRLRTSQGVTPSRPFVVGDLPEIVEEEIDGRPTAVPVSANTTINGRIFPREDVDRWVIDARAGQSYCCSVAASVLQSPLDSLLQVFGPNGRLLTENDDCEFSTDSKLTFRAKQDGRYEIRIFDSQFRGLQNFVYRLTIREAAPISFYPIGANVDQPTTITLRDRQGNETVAKSPQGVQVGERELPLVTADGRATRPIRLLYDQRNEYRYERQNIVDGEFIGNGEIAGDTHQWTWHPREDAKYELTLRSNSSKHQWPLSLISTEGKVLAKFEPDASRPQQTTLSFRGVNEPVTIQIDPPRATDGATVYRLTCREQRPDFQLRLDTDAVTLYRGQTAKLKIHATRNNFAGEIRLKVIGQPAQAKITCKANKIPPKKPNATLDFTAAADAPVQPVHMTVVGEAEIDGKTIVRTAKLPSPLSHRDREDVLLGVSMPTPFTVDGVAFETRYGARGTVFRRHYVLHRNGFDGPLEIKLADRQIRHLQGVTAEPIQISGDQSEFDFPIRIPTWLEMNRTSRTVVAAVGRVKDEEGREHVVSFTSGAPKDQIILLTAPCPIAIRVEKESIRIRPGETIELPFQLDRGVLKPAAARVRLITPAHFTGIEAAPITLDDAATSGVLRLQVGEQLPQLNMPITLRAEMPVGDDTVIAETSVELTK